MRLSDHLHLRFSRLLRHTPAEVLGHDARRNDGLPRAWYRSCKEQGVNPRLSSRLPLLFALNKKFAIPGGGVALQVAGLPAGGSFELGLSDGRGPLRVLLPR